MNNESAFPDAHPRGAFDADAKEGEFTDRMRVDLADIDANAPSSSHAPNDKLGKDFSADDANVIGVDDQDDDEKERGFCGSVLHYFRLLVPYGGLLSCTFNMSSATLGAGIISLPSGFNMSGIIMSCIYLILVTMGTVYSLNLIARVITKTGLKTYPEAARTLLGAGADHFLAALIIILCFGGSVAYVIATSTLLTPVLQTPNSPEYLKTKSGLRLMTALVWLCLMLPLALPRQINSLRYMSTIGVFFIFYFVVCVIVHSAQNGLHNPEVRKEMVLMRTGNAALDGLGLFMFSFMCQINAFEIFVEMKKRSVFHFTLYGTIAMSMCAVLYFLAGFFGYADFGLRVTDSILVLYDPVKEPYMAVAYVGIVVKICVAFALHMIPFRDAIYHFLNWKAATIPFWKHASVMLIPTTAALLAGLFIPKLNAVLGLLGSFCGGMIGMVMPALFFMYCGNFSLKESGAVTYFCTYALLFGGVVAVVFGTTSTVYGNIINSPF